jgi:hypothetical protein
MRVIRRTPSAVFLTFDVPSAIPDQAAYFAALENANKNVSNNTNATNATAEIIDKYKFSYFSTMARQGKHVLENPMDRDYAVPSLEYVYKNLSSIYPLPPLPMPVVNQSTNSCYVLNGTNSTQYVLVNNHTGVNCTWLTGCAAPGVNCTNVTVAAGSSTVVNATDATNVTEVVKDPWGFDFRPLCD